MPAEPWFSVEDFECHLGARSSFYRWIEHKGLPAHRIGRLGKLKYSEVDDWVRSGGAADPESALEDNNKEGSR